MGKYVIRFCRCGHIHIVPTSVIIEAAEKEKDVILICGHTGSMNHLSLDDIYNNSDDSYVSFTSDLSRFMDDFVFYYDKGLPVPMMTGRYADYYNDGIYYDYFTDPSQFFHSDDYILMRNSVNMNKLIKITSPEYLKEISQYVISGFNWDGTEYEIHRDVG